MLAGDPDCSGPKKQGLDFLFLELEVNYKSCYVNDL